MKVRASVKTMCPSCKIVVRRSSSSKKGGKIKRVVRVICSNPKHKQRQG